MRSREVTALRRTMREREGELRAVPMERIRHAMRRAAARAARSQREARA
jgi:hypothetical protein